MIIAIPGLRMRITTTAINKRNIVHTGPRSQWCTPGTLRGSFLNTRMRLDIPSWITTLTPQDDQDTTQSIPKTTNTTSTRSTTTTTSRTTPTGTSDHTAAGWSTTKRSPPTPPISPTARHTGIQTAPRPSTELRRNQSCL